MASTIKVDNVQNQPGTNIINKCSTTITIGASSDTIALAAGASQTGFGRTGTVDWVTTPKVTGDSPITAVTGKGYFLDTTAGTITLNLPAGAAGSIVSMADYAATWQTNNVTVAANGSEKIGGDTNDVTLNTEGQSVTLVYIDSTQGWINTMDSTSNVRGLPPFIVATGGTPCAGQTSGDYKYHTFLGPGTFCVSNVSPSAPQNVVSYMVAAGGGGGGGAQGNGTCAAGGGGAGGFREYKNSCDPYTASPLNGNPGGTAITVLATPYPITVGAGGATGGQCGRGGDGNNSIFSTITSAAGGGGGGKGPSSPFFNGNAGGSGGGSGSGPGTGGSGDTPPTTPAQGFAGGSSSYGAGGGGATAVGTLNAGGAGATSSINATPTGRAGGGGGGAPGGGPQSGSPGPASDGGGAGGDNANGTNGGCNTGGGAGGGPVADGYAGGVGGSGVVIIRYKFQ